MKKTTIIAKMDSKGRVVEKKAVSSRAENIQGFSEDANIYDAGPENLPLSPEKLARMKRVPRVKTLRRALQLTQEEFAARYQIPIGTLRDWEQGRSEPDAPAKAYLKVIARNPEPVRRSLASLAGLGRMGRTQAEVDDYVRELRDDWND